MKPIAMLAAAVTLAAAPALGKDGAGSAAVEAAFAAAYGELCYSAFMTDEVPPPESHTLSFSYNSDGDLAGMREATLYSFFCTMGAYNRTDVYFLINGFGEIEPVAFAAPEFDVRYENDDFDGAVEEITVTGWSAQVQLVNAEFDPGTQTITSYSLWRGLGDASSTGVWVFRDGRFVLVSYDVDASYDGEMNPERLVDFGG